MISIKQLLEHARAKQATDIHIRADAPIFFRISGDLVPITSENMTAEQSQEMVLKLLTEDQKIKFEETLDYDLMLIDESGRYRVNIGYFNGNVGAIIRLLSAKPNTIKELFLPDIVRELAHLKKGLVLITGSTSQGKTTTMASMINEINSTCQKHIITVEDPIEYVHKNKKSVVTQREIGKDTKTFASGLRAALRQDPDVIAIGEMRDYETIQIALTAAETGILVLSTLHTISIDKVIERLLSYGPPDSNATSRYTLAETLQGIVHQELLPTIDGKQRVACEVLVANDGVRNIIRRNDGFLLRNVITTGKSQGMLRMAHSVRDLLREKIISSNTAQSILVNYQA